MKALTRTGATAILLALGLVATADASLVDRGGGLIYDTVLDVTWLQNANLAMTSGYDADGLMTWDQSNTWASNLAYYDAIRHVTYSDWRLPMMRPANDVAFDTNGFSFDGSTDVGFNVVGHNHSELGYMFYINLGLKGLFDSLGNFQSDFGVPSSTVGLIAGLESDVYWSATEPDANSDAAFAFSTGTGYQGIDFRYNEWRSWAVRPGDVAGAVDPGNHMPEPASISLAALALLAIATSRCLGAPKC